MASTFDYPSFNEGTATSYIAAVRWPNGPVCPFCRASEHIDQDPEFASNGRFSCQKCGRSFTVTTGTSIARSAIPASKWLKAFQILGAAPSKSLNTILSGIFHPVDTDPNIRLSVDGRILEPEIADPLTFSFTIDNVPEELLILSRYFVPAKLDPTSTDPRRLGIGIKSIVIRDANSTFEWLHDDPALITGFHAPENGQRWTTGRAIVPAQHFPRLQGRITLVINLSHRNGLYPLD